jgi:hypothetical protein
MALHGLQALGVVVLAALVAPLLLGWIPAVAGLRRSETDVYRRTFACSMIAMPLVLGACAWFGCWKVPLASGPANQPVAITVGVLFTVQSLFWFYWPLSMGAAMSGSRGERRPEHPFLFPYRCFYNWAYTDILFSIPLALLVAVIALIVSAQ